MSGKGTNSGVNFQQSTSTHFLMHMLLELSLDNIFEDDFENEKIEEIFLETTDKIDDIKVELYSGKKLYIQVKNNCSASMKPNSDLYKSFEQIVKQFQLQKQNEHFVICTSLDTVKDIKNLKRLFAEIRKNPKNYLKNNFSKYEKSLLSKITSLIKEISSTISKTSINNLLSKTYILIIDPSKKDYMLLLNYLKDGCSDNMAKLLWDSIQEDSISSAATGSSFSKEGIQKKYLPYFIKNKKQQIYNDIQNYNFSFDKDFYVTKDIQSSNYTLYVVDRGYKVQYKNEKVIRRFSTIEQAERYLNVSNIKYHVINNFNDVDDINTTPLMNEKMKIQLSQSDISKCIHCSNPINNSEKTVVEIDLHHLANNMKLKVDTIGVIHDECIKPNDRYLGLINFSNSINEIDNIDIQEWETAKKNGHGLLKNYLNIPEVKLIKDIIFVWEPFEEYTTDEKFCVQYQHFNGGISFEVYRQKLHRLTYDNAKNLVDNFNENYENYENYLFSNGDIESKKMNAQVIEFSTIIEKKYNKFENYYAPLICLSNGEEYLIIDNKIIFITDLFQLQTFKEHCINNGIDISRYKSTFIKDDNHFDKIMTKHYYSKKISGAALDPILNNGTILKSKNILNQVMTISNIKGNS